MGRHSCCTKQKLRKGLWSPEEDEKLFNYITRFGVGCWSSVPKLAGLQRCGKSCRLRWINYLRPDLKRGMFSQQEEDLIVSLHKILGNRWAQIAAQLPGRTDNEIKNLWNSSLKKKLMKQGIDPTTHQPLKDQSSELSQSRKNDAVSSTHSHLLPPPIMTVKSEQPIFLDETTLTNNDQLQHFFIKPTFQVSSSDFEPMLGGPTGFNSLSQNQEYYGFGLEFSDPTDIIPRVDSFSTYNTSNEAKESSSYSSISSKVNVGEMNSTGQFCNLDGISGNYTKLEGLFDQYDYNDDQYNKKEMNAILSSVVDEFDKDRKTDNPWLMEPLERTGFDELQLSSSYPLKLISEELGSSNFDIFQQLL